MAVSDIVLLVTSSHSACSYLVRYVQAQTVNNGGEQTTTEPKNVPPLPTSKRRNKKSDKEKQCKNKHRIEPSQIENKDRYWSVISEVEGLVGFVRTLLLTSLLACMLTPVFSFVFMAVG